MELFEIDMREHSRTYDLKYIIQEHCDALDEIIDKFQEINYKK
jgi:hypothetical protein